MSSTTQETRPWQKDILDAINGGDVEERLTHVVIHKHPNHLSPGVLELRESEASATVAAEDYATKLEGEVSVVPLASLRAWAEANPGIAATPARDGIDILAETEPDTEPIPGIATTSPSPGGLPLPGPEVEGAEITQDVDVEGAEPGPDADAGKLFDIPRIGIVVDETDPAVIKLAFSGSVDIDRNVEDQVRVFNRLKAGKVVSLHVVAYVKSGPVNVHRRDSEGNVDAIVASKSIVITDIRLD